MQLELYFTEKEQIKFLRSRGFSVEHKVISMGYPCYHDDMEHEDVKVYAVYKNGKEYEKPCGYNFRRDEWVETVFEQEMLLKLKLLLL